ncbi:MAG: DedA family protein [Planctomycetota bacterium JB042]
MDLFGFLSDLFLTHGYLAVFVVLLLCGLGLPIPEELTLVGSGLVVYEGRANLYAMMGVTVVGILAGDALLMILGRRYGPQLLQKPLFRRLLHADRMNKVQQQFDRHGVKAVFFARFFAGIRACVYFTAGTLGMRFRTFLLLDLAGALLSAPISVWLGFRFGGEISRALGVLKRFEHVLVGLVVLFVVWTLGRWLWRRRRKS